MLQRFPLLPAALAAVLLAALGGCSDPNAQARGEFLSGCIQGGASKSLCSCIFEHLETRLSHEELRQLMQPSVSSPPAKLMREAAQALMVCRKS